MNLGKKFQESMMFICETERMLQDVPLPNETKVALDKCFKDLDDLNIKTKDDLTTDKVVSVIVILNKIYKIFGIE